MYSDVIKSINVVTYFVVLQNNIICVCLRKRKQYNIKGICLSIINQLVTLFGRKSHNLVFIYKNAKICFKVKKEDTFGIEDSKGNVSLGKSIFEKVKKVQISNYLNSNSDSSIQLGHGVGLLRRAMTRER